MDHIQVTSNTDSQKTGVEHFKNVEQKSGTNSVMLLNYLLNLRNKL